MTTQTTASINAKLDKLADVMTDTAADEAVAVSTLVAAVNPEGKQAVTEAIHAAIKNLAACKAITLIGSECIISKQLIVAFDACEEITLPRIGHVWFVNSKGGAAMGNRADALDKSAGRGSNMVEAICDAIGNNAASIQGWSFR